MSRQNQIIAYAIMVLLHVHIFCLPTSMHILQYLHTCSIPLPAPNPPITSDSPRDPPPTVETTALAACNFKEHNTFDAPELPERPNLAKIFIKGMPKRRKDAPLNWVWQGWSSMVGGEPSMAPQDLQSPWTGRISSGSNIHHSSIDITSTHFKFILNGTYIYIYIILYIHCVCIYIYIHTVHIYIYTQCIYIYIYNYIYIYIYV